MSSSTGPTPASHPGPRPAAAAPTQPGPGAASAAAVADPPSGSSSTGGRGWYRNRFVWVAVILLAISATAIALVRNAGADDSPEAIREQLDVRLLTLLEEVEPEQHKGHGDLANQANKAEAKVICGVHSFAYEPKDAAAADDVERVYAFHLCGVAEPKKPWDWATKLVGPVIVGLADEPPTIEVAAATETVSYRDRVKQMFPPEYQDQAFNDFLTKDGMAELRRRYDAAAGL